MRDQAYMYSTVTKVKGQSKHSREKLMDPVQLMRASIEDIKAGRIRKL